MKPPKAKIIPHQLEVHGHIRIDNYYWLRKRESEEVIAYLKAENTYLKQQMAHTAKFQEKLFEEMKGRIKKDDRSVPYKLDNYYYYSRFEKGKEYAIYCRKLKSLESKEEIILDVNSIAKGQAFCQVTGNTVSSNHQFLAYARDIVGRRIYTIFIKDLGTGELLSEQIPNTTGNICWANDNRTFFYTVQDQESLRSYRVYRHTLGENPDNDVLIYEEKDETFGVGVEKSKSKQYLFIGSFSTLTTEYQYLDANTPYGEFRIFQERQRAHEYEIDHYEDHFYIRSNLEAKNFRLLKTSIKNTSCENWVEVVPHRNDVLLESVEIFKDFLVLEERKEGLTHIRIQPWKNPKSEYYLEFEEATYVADVDYNPEFDTKYLRFTYESLTTPSSTYDFDMKSKEKIPRKEREILGGFNRQNYQSERIYAQAQDGTSIPISLVYHKNTRLADKPPLLLYAYGSYGISMDPYFSSSRLSLIDRGFIYAIAHIRGGSEMGRYWYEDGKLLKKKNTFTDFIDCAKHLLGQGITQSDRLFAMGGSAGGMLMGVVINMEPKLFHGVVAAVPFVDVITTMLDESIPLTTGEYDEWGNPNDKTYYDYMLSYSPYDNIRKQDYPHLLVTSGLHDSQVQYWEPTKWVAKLRINKTDQHRLFLHTNMEAGHGGASGRFNRLKEVALEYVFLLDLAEAGSERREARSEKREDSAV